MGWYFLKITESMQATTTEAHALQQEKLQPWEAIAPQLEKALTPNKDPAQPNK